MSRRRWWILAAISWMALIFCVTQLPYFTGENTAEAIHKVAESESNSIHIASADQNEINSLNFIIRKATHLTAFGILSILLFKLIQPYRFSFLLSWVLTCLYAMTDEYHQSFMPGRTASFKDVLIDSLGALIVLTLTYLIMKKQRKVNAK